MTILDIRRIGDPVLRTRAAEVTDFDTELRTLVRDLTESMLDPSAFISPVWTGANGPTTGMPRLTLTNDEVASLVEYLLSDPSARSG